jgi:lysophospholipase L1-like esterase
MDRRIAKTRAARAVAVAAALSGALAALPAAAQDKPAEPPAAAAAPLSKACQPGAAAIADQSPLPNVAAALAKRKALRILAFGAAPGRVSARGAYTDVIEAMLAGALKGIEVSVINRGVSGELAANAATRMKNEVALEEPDLVLWQVGTNDALAYVPTAEFTDTVKEQVDWLKAHNVDVVLVGLQYAPQTLRDEHYIRIREALRKLGIDEKVIVIRFYEAAQMLSQQAAGASGEPVADQIARSDDDYNCLAQYVARAITLGTFAKTMPKRP